MCQFVSSCLYQLIFEQIFCWERWWHHKSSKVVHKDNLLPQVWFGWQVSVGLKVSCLQCIRIIMTAVITIDMIKLTIKKIVWLILMNNLRVFSHDLPLDFFSKNFPKYWVLCDCGLELPIVFMVTVSYNYWNIYGFVFQ